MNTIYPDFYWSAPHSRARLVEAFLGAWLYASGFLWAHARAEFLDASVMGGAMFLFAMAAYWRVTWLRWSNLVLAVGLFASVVAMPSIGRATGLNHLLVSMVVLVSSFIPLVRVPVDEPAAA